MKTQHSSLQLLSCVWPQGRQHARLPCPSPTPWACSNSCLSSRWCHPTISSSVIPFSFCLQSFPASGSFLMSQFFASGGQSIGASASVLPMNIQDWFLKTKQKLVHIVWCSECVVCHPDPPALLQDGTTYFPNCRNVCGWQLLMSSFPGISPSFIPNNWLLWFIKAWMLCLNLKQF